MCDREDFRAHFGSDDDDDDDGDDESHKGMIKFIFTQRYIGEVHVPPSHQ
jgi:hypothetical protein